MGQFLIGSFLGLYHQLCNFGGGKISEMGVRSDFQGKNVCNIPVYCVLVPQHLLPVNGTIPVYSQRLKIHTESDLILLTEVFLPLHPVYTILCELKSLAAIHFRLSPQYHRMFHQSKGKNNFARCTILLVKMKDNATETRQTY